MTIVCATDFSDSSFNAVRVASALARQHQQRLWLVHVVPHRTIRLPAAKMEAAAREALLLEATALGTPSGDFAEGLEVKSEVLHGPLAQTVAQFCTDRDALLLVVGESNHKRTMLPSPLDKFAHGVATPMLVVHDPKPFVEWAHGERPLKVMLALDHSWSSARARDWIKRLSEYGPLELTAAHIWWPREEYERRGLVIPPAEEAHAALTGLMRNETEAALAGLPPNVKHRVHLKVGVGHIGEQLLELARDEAVDMLVLGTHPHYGPLGRRTSVSHQALAQASMSVAVIPPGNGYPVQDHGRWVVSEPAAKGPTGSSRR